MKKKFCVCIFCPFNFFNDTYFLYFEALVILDRIGFVPNCSLKRNLKQKWYKTKSNQKVLKNEEKKTSAKINECFVM